MTINTASVDTSDEKRDGHLRSPDFLDVDNYPTMTFRSTKVDINRDKAAQMGDVLVDQIPGGLTVMSSITPARNADGTRRRMSPTQSPYFRVLEKGERLPPKPGRADDFSWPRPQATAEVRGEPPAMVPMATAARNTNRCTCALLTET